MEIPKVAQRTAPRHDNVDDDADDDHDHDSDHEHDHHHPTTTKTTTTASGSRIQAQRLFVIRCSALPSLREAALFVAGKFFAVGRLLELVPSGRSNHI